METNQEKKGAPLSEELVTQQLSRKKFFSYAGLFGVTATMATGCAKEIDFWDKRPRKNVDEIDLGEGDVGVLNFAYSLEQLEAAFYTQVTAMPYAGMSERERVYLHDLRDHEIAHREFFKKVLGADAIPELKVDFSIVDFKSRRSVLETARMFEDLGVAAYNGTGQLLKNVNNLVLAGKIVSVEARHAAIIRNLLRMGSFADRTIVNNQGLDVVLDPVQVLETVGPFIKTVLSAARLPKL